MRTVTIVVLCVVIVLLWLLTTLPAYGATYYVAPGGSNGNAGSLAAPFQTILYAQGVMASGDTLLIRAGTYNETINGYTIPLPSGISWATATTFAGYPGEWPILKGCLSAGGDAPSYVIFKDFICDGTGDPDTTGAAVDSGHHLRLENLEIRNYAGNGLYLHTPTEYIEILRNRVHDNSENFFDQGIYHAGKNSLLDGNQVYNNGAFGIQVWKDGGGNDNNVVVNNVVYGNGGGGNCCAGLVVGFGHNALVANNVAYNEAGLAIQVTNNGFTQNNQVYNNTVSTSGVGIQLGPGAYQTKVKNNILWSVTTALSNLGSESDISHSLTTNPLFVNAGAGDFHLQAGSPAIDAGVTLAAVLSDRAGVSRPQGAAYDIGAYEFSAEAPPGTTIAVSTAAELTAALATAVAGDTIVLANGTYSGTFTTTNAGTASQPITLRAANRHQAVLVGDNACDRSHEGLVLADAYWVVKDLHFTQHGGAITVTGSNNEVAHNLVEGYREEGIRVLAGDTNFLHHNVIGYSGACPGTDSPGIFLVGDADGNTVQDNIIVGTGDNGYQYGEKFGYGIYVVNHSDDNVLQGNMLLGNAGKGVFRLLSDGYNSANVDRNIVRDNMLFFGEGGFSTDDCTDDSNQFINNFVYGLYHSSWSTKGNLDGTKGHHTVQHNTLITTPFSRSGASLGPGGCPESVRNYKIANTVLDNVLYDAGPANAGSGEHFLWRVVNQGSTPSSITVSNYNFFWAQSAEATWTANYTLGANDLHAFGSPPTFTDIATGDYTLAAGSLGTPGNNPASDGTSRGIAWNTYLKKPWAAHVFALPTQENAALTGATSTAFAVSASRSYQVWFYIPNTPCAQSAESFTVEGTTGLVRDITGLTTGGDWVQPGGPARYITLGRHRATDGTLNVSWQHTGCVERVFIRELPTAQEAYSWISAEAPPDSVGGLEMRLGLNEGTGTTAADLTGNGHTGTISGGATWVSGQIGAGALTCNGSTGQVQVSGLLGSPSALTLAAWVQLPAGPTTTMDVVSVGDAVGLRLNPSPPNVLGFFYDGTAWHELGTLLTFDTAWHHLVYTVQAGSQALYVDGVLQASASVGPGPAYSGVGTNTMLCTHGNGQTTFRLNGTVDDVRVYAKVLTAAEVGGLSAWRDAPPTLAVTAPTSGATYETATSPLTTLAGTASDDGALGPVSWGCPSCPTTSGVATGTTTWGIPSLALTPGLNFVTIWVYDGENQSAQDTLTITYTPTPGPANPCPGKRHRPGQTMGGAAR